MSYKYNPLTGQLDYFEEQQDTTIESAQRLQDTRIYGEPISALKMVIAVNDTDILLANKDTYTTAKCLGISLQAGTVGFNGEVLLFGKVEDNSFNFPINEPLFLSYNGGITNVPPITEFSVNIGHSLGTGAIFIDIKEPIEL